jgi:hypothetical protein
MGFSARGAGPFTLIFYSRMKSAVWPAADVRS